MDATTRRGVKVIEKATGRCSVRRWVLRKEGQKDGVDERDVGNMRMNSKHE